MKSIEKTDQRCTISHFLDLNVYKRVIMNLSGIHIQGALLNNGDFNFADINRSVFNDTSFIKTRMAGANLRGTQFIDCQFNGTTLILANLSDSTSFTNSNVSHALFLGAKMNDALVTDEFLAHQGAINVDTAITSVAKLQAMLEQHQISKTEAEFFKAQINETYGIINSYRIRVSQHMFLQPEWAVLAPYCTPSNFHIMQEAYLVLEQHLMLEQQAHSQEEEENPSASFSLFS